VLATVFAYPSIVTTVVGGDELQIPCPTATPDRGVDDVAAAKDGSVTGDLDGDVPLARGVVLHLAGIDLF
jgi:hypothetical protein